MIVLSIDGDLYETREENNDGQVDLSIYSLLWEYRDRLRSKTTPYIIITLKSNNVISNNRENAYA